MTVEPLPFPWGRSLRRGVLVASCFFTSQGCLDGGDVTALVDARSASESDTRFAAPARDAFDA